MNEPAVVFTTSSDIEASVVIAAIWVRIGERVLKYSNEWKR